MRCKNPGDVHILAAEILWDTLPRCKNTLVLRCRAMPATQRGVRPNLFEIFGPFSATFGDGSFFLGRPTTCLLRLSHSLNSFVYVSRVCLGEIRGKFGRILPESRKAYSPGFRAPGKANLPQHCFGPFSEPCGRGVFSFSGLSNDLLVALHWNTRPSAGDDSLEECSGCGRSDRDEALNAVMRLVAEIKGKKGLGTGQLRHCFDS